jgi:antitoxin MazE
MEADIVPIGNSKGIRIPSHILKQCGIDKKVVIEVDGNKITLVPVRSLRQGWEESFKKAAARIREDELVIYDDSIDLDKLEEYLDGNRTV